MKSTGKTSDESLRIGEHEVALGERRNIEVAVSQTFSGKDVMVPMQVVRAPRPGPAVLISGAVHGDEINGTGIVRQILLRQPFDLVRGSLVLVPVVNVPGFERQSRYLPDRRDLNRSFPGSAQGSLTRRYAHAFFDQVVRHVDFGIDLHTGGGRRTNFPNVRADMSDPEVARLAHAFGAEIVVDSGGPDGSLRATASAAGMPTILLEAGEVLKVEPDVVEVGIRGIRNVLISLEMIEGEPEAPAFQALIQRSKWMRADCGGMLRFHVGPGELVREGRRIASVSTLLGELRGDVCATATGIVMGLTTLPTIKPGDPVVNLALPQGDLSAIEKALDEAEDSLYSRMREALSDNIVIERETKK